MSPKSRSKVKSCVRAIELLGIEDSELFSRYQGHRFRGAAVEKASLFQSVFSGTVTAQQAEFLGDVCNLPYHRDTRSSVEYGIDLALGWLIEDALAHRLKRAGAKVSLTGHDREREYLLAHEISQEPDLRISWLEAERRVEVMCDWLDTWRTRDHLDLRDRKFARLQSEKALLFGIAPGSASGLVLSAAAESGAFRFNSSIQGYGGKPGYTARGVSSRLIPVDAAVELLLELVANGSL